ncbi:MAG: hypothetical protein QM820_32485 [Minicystis sp.]
MATVAPESDLFFIEGLGFIAAGDPYRVLDLPRDAPHDELRATLPEEGWPRTILASPAHRLAWHLVEQPTAEPTIRDHVRALFDAGAQHAVVVHLLRDALVGQIDEHDRMWCSRWEIAEAVWSSFLQSSRAQRWLAKMAQRLGLPDPSATAKVVLACAETELFPGLHAIYALHGQPERRAFHGACLQRARGTGLAVRHVDRILREEQIQAALEARRQGRHAEALRAYTAASARGGGDRGWLAAEMAAVTGEALEAVGKLQPDELSSLLGELEAAAREAPHDPRLFAAMFVLHMRCGAACINERELFNEGGLHFAKAAVIEPANKQPGRLLDEARQILAKLGATIEIAALSGGVLNDRGLRLRQEAARGMRAAMAFAGSEQGVRLRTQRDASIWTAIAARLGVDPEHERAIPAARAVASTLATEELRRVPFSELWNALMKAEPILADASLQAAESAFGERRPTSAWEVFEALPAPARVVPPDDPFLVIARKRIRKAFSARAAPSNRTQLYGWLFSTMDLHAKLPAAAGIVLLLAGSGHAVGRAWDSWRRDVAYVEIGVATAAGRDGDALDAARAFLAHAGDTDERRSEVRRALEGALGREMSRAAREDDDRALEALLAKARALAGEKETKR